MGSLPDREYPEALQNQSSPKTCLSGNIHEAGNASLGHAS